MFIWLVVTGTMEFYDFPYIGNGMSSSQLTKSIIFQRGRYTTNQSSNCNIPSGDSTLRWKKWIYSSCADVPIKKKKSIATLFYQRVFVIYVYRCSNVFSTIFPGNIGRLILTPGNTDPKRGPFEEEQIVFQPPFGRVYVSWIKAMCFLISNHPFRVGEYCRPI